MSNLVSQLFERLGDIVPEIGAEVSRLGSRGSMEMASALFNGHSFVQYGPGASTASPEQQPEVEHERAMGIER